MKFDEVTVDGKRYRLVPVEDNAGSFVLKEDMKNVDVAVKVLKDWKLNVFTRQNDGSEGRVHSFLVQAGSWKFKLAVWDDHTATTKGVKIGDTLVITKGYVKKGQEKTLEDGSFGGHWLELHVGKYSDIAIAPKED